MIEPEINISIKRNITAEVDRKWLEKIARVVLETEVISPSTEM